MKYLTLAAVDTLAISAPLAALVAFGVTGNALFFISGLAIFIGLTCAATKY